MADDRTTIPAGDEDFFLPDLCETQSILFLVLVAELLVFVVVLAQSVLVDFSWTALGLTSLFVQWVVLASAAVLCNLRPWLARMHTIVSITVGYLLILLVTLVFSMIAEWILMPLEWGEEQTGGVARNILIGAVMAGIAFRYFYLQHRLRRQEQAELNSRIQALQSRIRPHFLFNSMNIIASLIVVDPDTAEEVVEDLSALFRASLDESTSSPVPLAEEIDLCDKYVHIESLRLEDRLGVTWDVTVDESEVRIPMLTLQPLIENAIYHGIQPNPEGGVVSVVIRDEHGMLVVEISNPLPPGAFAHEGGNRMAIENIRRRLDAFYGAEAKLITEKTETTFTTRISYPWRQ